VLLCSYAGLNNFAFAEVCGKILLPAKNLFHNGCSSEENGTRRMIEFAPFAIAAVLGTLIARYAIPRSWPVLLAVVLVSGASGTILSGEYAVSWSYLIKDAAEAAVGLACGMVVARAFSRL
jgi:hypothetical protein